MRSRSSSRWAFSRALWCCCKAGMLALSSEIVVGKAVCFNRKYRCSSKTARADKGRQRTIDDKGSQRPPTKGRQ